ncbi:MAG: hypothetical protein ACHWZW_06970 [Spirulina sp.]
MRVPHRHWAGLGPVVNPVSPAGRPPAVRLLAVVGCALLGNATMTLPRSAAWAQTVSSATVTEVLDSNQVFIQNQRAAVNSVAQRQQRVRTQDARASLRFNNGAVARLAHNSSLMVGQCAQLNRGTLLVNGSLNGCSTTTVAGVRGTLYTMEVTEDGETIVKVFEGEVIVGQRTDAPMPEPPDDLDDEGMEGDSLDNGILENGIPDDEIPDGGMLEDDPVGDETSDPEALGDDLDLENPNPDNGDTPNSEFPPTKAQVNLGAGAKQTTAPAGRPDNSPPGANDPSGNDSDGSGSPFGIEIDLSPQAEDTPADTTETVEFNPDTALVINEGQQVTVNAESDEAVIATLTAEDFINLLEGPLIQGFVMDLPGISDLESVFRRLFPSIPLPFGLPSIIIPLPPIRFPF